MCVRDRILEIGLLGQSTNTCVILLVIKIYLHRDCFAMTNRNIGKCFSTTLSTKYVVRFGILQTYRWEIVTPYTFDFHFSYYGWSWASFHMVKNHVHFSYELSIHFSCLVCYRVVGLFLLYFGNESIILVKIQFPTL